MINYFLYVYNDKNSTNVLWGMNSEILIVH